MKICFLVSGGGGNYKFLHLAIKKNILKNITISVLADRECKGLEYAKGNAIVSKLINYNRNSILELSEELKNLKPDIIVTNWHKIIDHQTVKNYSGKMINLHYSLLPSFGKMIGIAPIEEVFKKNCKYAGTTCHYVNENVDDGQIIAQAIVRTELGLDKTIKEVFRKGCLILLNSLIELSHENLINIEDNLKFEYSPYLKFNDELFDESFWHELSKL